MHGPASLPLTKQKRDRGAGERVGEGDRAAYVRACRQRSAAAAAHARGCEAGHRVVLHPDVGVVSGRRCLVAMSGFTRARRTLGGVAGDVARTIARTARNPKGIAGLATRGEQENNTTPHQSERTCAQALARAKRQCGVSRTTLSTCADNKRDAM